MTTKQAIIKRWALAASVFMLLLAPAPAALVAYYDFEGNLLDGSGQGNNGVHSSTATYSTDVAGAVSGTNSLVIGDGAGRGYMTVAHDASLAFSSGTASFSLWLKSDSPGNWNKFIDKGSVFLAERRSGNPDGRLLVNGSNMGNISNLGNIVTGGWNHIAFTLDNGTFTSYLNGTQVASLTYTGSLTTTDALVLGAGSTGGLDAFEGFLDEVAIYDTVLTSPEVAALAAGGSPIPEPSAALLGGLGALLLLRRRRG